MSEGTAASDSAAVAHASDRDAPYIGSPYPLPNEIAARSNSGRFSSSLCMSDTYIGGSSQLSSARASMNLSWKLRDERAVAAPHKQTRASEVL